MGEMLFMAHSGWRYLVLLTAVVAAVLVAMSLRAGVLTRAAETAGRVYVGVLDVQLLLGILVLLTRPFFPALIGHLVLMVFAIGVAHGVWVAVRRRPASARPPVLMLAGIVGSLLLVVAGILAIGRPLV